MLKYLIKRTLSMIPVVLLVTIILFTIVKLMPGDPIQMMLDPGLRGEQYDAAYAAMSERLGLDKSYIEQYLRWLNNIIKGDFGWSTMYNRPVKTAIAEPLRNTAALKSLVIVLQLLITIPVGILCAVKRGSLFDKFWQVFSLITYSMPTFFIGISLIYFFAIKVHLFPPSGMPIAAYGRGFAYYASWLKYMTLPVITLVIVGLAGTIRYVRNAMIEALSQDYIRTARSKGLPEKVIIYSHAFRNALIPISTIMIFSVFTLFSGSAIVETVFAWNGIGSVLVQGLRARDYMLVGAINLLFASLGIMANFIADITYGLVDPRIKLD